MVSTGLEPACAAAENPGRVPLLPMRIGYYQFRPLFGKVQRNLAQVCTALDGCGAELLVLPELAFTGYCFRDRAELLELCEEPGASATVEELHRLCVRNQFHLVTGFAERDGDRCFNSALLIGPRGVEHIYRKLHLFNEEKRYFDPGDVELCVNQVGTARIGIMICFDWLFPETARVLALGGADVLCHPCNLVLSHCQQVMPARSLENGVYAVTANRCGADQRPWGKLCFTGKSQITAPDGTLLHRGPSRARQLHLHEIDLAQARDKQITPLNYKLTDRRPAHYRALTG